MSTYTKGLNKKFIKWCKQIFSMKVITFKNYTYISNDFDVTTSKKKVKGED